MHQQYYTGPFACTYKLSVIQIHIEIPKYNTSLSLNKKYQLIDISNKGFH